MLSNRNLLSMLAVGGLFVGTQASGAIVAQNDTMLDGGTNLGVVEYFGFGGPVTGAGSAASDGNQFAIVGQTGNNSGAGISHHVDVADVTTALGGPLVDGTTLRASAWVVSDPNDPWLDLATEGIKIEFYNVALGAFGTIDMTNETENGFGLGLQPDVGAVVNTGGWTQISLTVEITDALVDFTSLAEVRPVLFLGDFTGASPAAGGGGSLLVDGMTLEVFSNLATANATPLPANTPGGFDTVDLSGDINGDGFVGIADLNIVLGTWNNGIPPAAGSPSIPEPASLALLGLGGLTLLRRRSA